MFIALLILAILALFVMADNIFGSYWGALIIVASFIAAGILGEELEIYLDLRRERKCREREERERKENEKAHLEREKQETYAKINEPDDNKDDDEIDEFDDDDDDVLDDLDDLEEFDELDYPDIPAGYLVKKPRKNRSIKRNKTYPLKRKKTRIEY